MRMPAGTPLGIGLLGSMRLSAIRRVYEHAQRAAAAKASYHDAQGAVADALTRREAAFEQLENIDIIRADVADGIIEGAASNKLRRKRDRLQLEAEVEALEAAARQRRATAAQPSVPNAATPPQQDEFNQTLVLLRRMPEVAKAAADVKAEIVRSAGGDDRLTEADRDMLATIDAIVQSATSRQAEDSLR